MVYMGGANDGCYFVSPFILYNHGRFLYPIYPLICVAASAVIESFPDFFRDKYNPNANSLLVTVSCCFVLIIIILIDQCLTLHCLAGGKSC